MFCKQADHQAYLNSKYQFQNTKMAHSTESKAIEVGILCLLSKLFESRIPWSETHIWTDDVCSHCYHLRVRVHRSSQYGIHLFFWHPQIRQSAAIKMRHQVPRPEEYLDTTGDWVAICYCSHTGCWNWRDQEGRSSRRTRSCLGCNPQTTFPLRSRQVPIHGRIFFIKVPSCINLVRASSKLVGSNDWTARWHPWKSRIGRFRQEQFETYEEWQVMQLQQSNTKTTNACLYIYTVVVHYTLYRHYIPWLLILHEEKSRQPSLMSMEDRHLFTNTVSR